MSSFRATPAATAYDVIVMGAGPAGSVTACELVRAGRKVLLVDRARFPRLKVCGCCLNGVTIAAIQRLGLGHVLIGGTPLTGVRLAACRRSADIPLPDGMALSRERLDTRLVDEAVNRGVEFLPGTIAQLSEERPDGRTVLLNGTPAVARVVVRATGLSGGETLPEPGSRIGAGLLIPADRVPSFFETSRIYMATSRHGYVGLVRVEDGRLDVAAAMDPAFVKTRGGPGRAAESILQETGWDLPNLRVDGWKGVPLLTRRPVRIAGERWFAVGDAGGYVEPFTGEGMAWAVLGAEAVAPLVSHGVENWDSSLTDRWERTRRELLGARQSRCRVVAQVLRHPRLCQVAVRALAVFPMLARPLVSALNH